LKVCEIRSVLRNRALNGFRHNPYKLIFPSRARLSGAQQIGITI